MSLDLWSLILSIPIAIIANIFTPKVQNWLNSRNNKKSLENEQHEELNTLKEENKKDSYEEFELVRARVVNIGIICIPFIIVIGSL